MQKTFARFVMDKRRTMSVLILCESETYFEVQVVKDQFWQTNEVVKISKSLIKSITDKI